MKEKNLRPRHKQDVKEVVDKIIKILNEHEILLGNIEPIFKLVKNELKKRRRWEYDRKNFE